MTRAPGPLETAALAFAETKPPADLTRRFTRAMEAKSADVLNALLVLYRIDTTGPDDPASI